MRFKSYICNCRSFILDNLDMKVTIIEKVMPNTVNHRLESEEWDIKTLNTQDPKGKHNNDLFYGSGLGMR